jgi:hypothetical protein
MKLADIFETKIEEKIEPVIKVGEVQDEAKLAAEIGAYVVTPTIERYLDEFLEHFTDSIRRDTSEIGVWISGYFGSGKSHLAKITGLLVQNRTLKGVSAAKRFEARIPSDASRRVSLLGSLARLDQCDTEVLGFNLNTLVDSKTTPLPRLLLSQYYQSRGYSSNLVYAKVIEREVDLLGKLALLHDEAARRANRPWEQIRGNPTFYARALCEAVCAVVPEHFKSAEDVEEGLRREDRGELINVQKLVETMLDDLAAREHRTRKPARLVLVLDESGQWIEDDGARLAQLTALVEEAAHRGKGKLWVVVTTHEDMGTVFQNARAVQADMKKMEGRFRFKWSLTTENIELVLEDRIFRKNLAGRDAVGAAYDAAPGVIRGLGELANVQGRRLPPCERDRFIAVYPFLPYQVHLVPEIVKSLRSKGGRGEQLSGSTRTLLGITQDILRQGRRPYLTSEVGELVSFDEVYANLADAGEVTPDVRRELSLVPQVVEDATALTARVAEVLFLIREIAYVPRTLDNIARLLVETTSDELPQVIRRVEPELDRLIAAQMVAKIGEEYEFLTGERRSFEEEVATVAAQIRAQDREAGLAKHFVHDPAERKNHFVNLVGLDRVPFKEAEFPVHVFVDDTAATRDGYIVVRIYSPLSAYKVPDLEDRSLRADEQQTIFVLTDRISGFDRDISRYLAMREVTQKWKGDSHRSEEARRLAEEREANDLPKLRRKVETGLKDGLRSAHVIFRGSSRALPGRGQSPGDALRTELATFWPTLYPKFEKVREKIVQEQKAILDVLRGEKNVAPEVRSLGLLDKAGQLDLQAPLVEATRLYLANRQSRNERTLGKNLLEEFEAPPYGWDRNAVRVGVAACVRAGLVKVQVGKLAYANPADPELQKKLRDSREFDRVELILEEADLAPEVLERARAALIQLTGRRRIDETPAALHEAMEEFGRAKLERAQRAQEWAELVNFPIPQAFTEGVDAFEEVLGFTNPMQRVRQVYERRETLGGASAALDVVADFREKWGPGYVTLRELGTQLGQIEHLLPEDTSCRRFVEEFEAARRGARVAEPAVWRGLQTVKADAELELQELLRRWREEARQVSTDARAGLAKSLEDLSLPPELEQVLAARLIEFEGTIGGENDPVRVAALPERSRRLVRELRAAIQREADRKTPPPKRDGQPPRDVRHVSLSAVAQVRRVRDTTEWERVARRLDEHVRGLLGEFEVELD